MGAQRVSPGSGLEAGLLSWALLLCLSSLPTFHHKAPVPSWQEPQEACGQVRARVKDKPKCQRGEEGVVESKVMSEGEPSQDLRGDHHTDYDRPAGPGFLDIPTS